jgi:AcrR family transcriptional regulator
LREAAFALAHERPVDEMTVGDIVARASVSRQVFYQHFRDRDDAVATAFPWLRRGDRRGRRRCPGTHPAPVRLRRVPVRVPQHRAGRGDTAGGDGVPRGTTTGLRGDRETWHARGLPDRQPDPGVGHPVSGRRVHRGAAVLDGRPGRDRPERPRQRGARHRQRTTRTHHILERSPAWLNTKPPSGIPRAAGDDRAHAPHAAETVGRAVAAKAGLTPPSRMSPRRRQGIHPAPSSSMRSSSSRSARPSGQRCWAASWARSGGR